MAFEFEPQARTITITQEEQERRRLEERRLLEQRLEQQRYVEQQRQLEVQRKRIEDYKTELCLTLEKTLSGSGYYPPEPTALVMGRALKNLIREVESNRKDPEFAAALATVEQEIEDRCKLANGYLEKLRTSLVRPTTLAQMLNRVKTGAHQSIYHATISAEMPEVNSLLAKRMNENEVFLARDWDQETHRGVLAVHVDQENKRTILQIGLAAYGPIYVTIPAILSPESQALSSIREMIKRLAAFRDGVDPLAVIDGSHQGLNYNEVFETSRVVRAPSGDTTRLARNLEESRKRERLAPDNTVILNSSPRSQDEYVRIFPDDEKANHWRAWGDEAQAWDEAVSSNRFAATQEVSQEALVAALSQSKNVIVVVAHCDGQSIFLPEPPPNGSQVSPDYLREHRQEIEANAPFVYLFSCQAGNLSGMRNFASTLLECGASGVIASQSNLGSEEGRTLLSRLLDENRGAPPIKDYFEAMSQVKFRDMEVFLG